MKYDIPELLKSAAAAREHAHAPYSHFRVGAAAVGDDDLVYTGTNVENASYGLTVCAERVAIFTAVASGCRRIRAMAIVADGQKPPSPCGACRQVLAEFAERGTDVYFAAADALDLYQAATLRELLPMAFDLREPQ